MGAVDQASCMLKALGFVPDGSESYLYALAEGIELILISSILPPERNIDKANLDRVRAADICCGIAGQDFIPAIDVTRSGSVYRYQLRNGYHRYHISIAAGFTKIPAVVHDDWFLP